MLKGISSVFSFLTIIPTHNFNLETVAKYMYLFPVVGMAIGLIVGSLGFGLSLFLEPLVVSLLVVVSLSLITGIHHTDGLSDFADGLMAKGSKLKKLQAMKDLSTGSAGIISIVLYMVGLIIALSLTFGYALLITILLSEIIAKFSMVLMASLGISASKGSNSPFIKLMKDRRKQATALAFTFVPVFILGGTTGLFALVIGVLLTLLLVSISIRSFGGITGDVLGATNELTRVSSILVFVSTTTLTI